MCESIFTFTLASAEEKVSWRGSTTGGNTTIVKRENGVTRRNGYSAANRLKMWEQMEINRQAIWLIAANGSNQYAGFRR